MKIKQLDVAGFRSLKQVSWQPGDLNVVIGQNGTGKSNLLRLLELIAASAQGRLSKYIQAAGGMDAILWDGVASSISFHLKTDDLPVAPNDYEVKLSSLGNTGWYCVEREQLIHQALPQEDPAQIATRYLESSYDHQAKTGESVSVWSSDANSSVAETRLSLATLTLDGEPTAQYKQVVQFRRRLYEITVYHDLNVGQDSKIRQAAVTRFEKRVEPDGQNLVQVLHTLYTGDREFRRNVDAAMRAAFGADYEEIVFPPAADQRVQLRLRWGTRHRADSAADLSDGTLRFLLLLTVLTAPDPPMLIAIDEPETGLHPTMLPIIAAFAVEAATRTQIVFTTHSPQFLSAFGKTRPTTTVASWENGETALHTLADDELEHWLAEYSLGALFESGQLEAMA